jgi:flagellar motor switch protein FliM
MAEGKLSQAEIDALFATISPAAGPDPDTRQLVEFDFRRPSKFAREHIRSLESAHELFARRFSGLLTHMLRTIVHVEPLSVDQVTYADYVRSMPTPTFLTVVDLDPLPVNMVVELSAQFGLTLVDRLLGGPGRPVPMRRPTDLEVTLLHSLMEHATTAVSEALHPLVEVDPSIVAVESNPAFVQVAPPGEMVLMLSFTVTLAASRRTEGLLSLCYPFSLLQPVMDRLEAHAWTEQRPLLPAGDEVTEHPFTQALDDVEVELSVRLRPTDVPAVDIATLRPGDVLRLTHRVDEPAVAVIGERPLLDGHLGKRGRRMALQLTGWRDRA